MNGRGGGCYLHVHTTGRKQDRAPEVVALDLDRIPVAAGSQAVQSVLSTPLPFETACETLQSDRHVNSYVENTFGYVKPIQYDKVDKKEYMQYVPISESMRMLTQNDDIFSSIIND